MTGVLLGIGAGSKAGLILCRGAFRDALALDATLAAIAFFRARAAVFDIAFEVDAAAITKSFAVETAALTAFAELAAFAFVSTRAAMIGIADAVANTASKTRERVAAAAKEDA